MITLRPLAELGHSEELRARIPKELWALISETVPWTGYAAFTSDGQSVGACGYKSAPTQKKEVEIAYMTFPEHEKRGYGTAMSRSLFEIDVASKKVDRVIAQTLREENASVRICRRLDFSFEGEVLDPEDGLVWRWSRQTA